MKKLNLAKIHAFAQFWLREYQDLPPLKDEYLYGRFPFICTELGFEMDLFDSLKEKFPTVYKNFSEETIRRVNNVQVLGNTIYSKFRVITHWEHEGCLCSPKNRPWFVAAFKRLAALTAAEAVPTHAEIEVVKADITTLKVDAIVNAANCELLGGGVDGAIHYAAGEELMDECQELVRQLPEHLGETGQAYLTKAGKLPCHYVIHTPGPVYEDGQHGEPELLAKCYENSLRRAEEMQCATIAFPCISTGVYGYPKKEAARIAFRTVREFSPVSLQKVVFCCFLKEDAEIYRQLLAEEKERQDLVRKETGD